MKVICWKTITSLVALMVAGLWGVTVVRHIEVEAQYTQNILGSSPLYSLSGADGWINSKPLTAKELKGRLFSSLSGTIPASTASAPFPYIRAWADKYGNSGLIVIGVHTPEFDIEKEMPNVETLSRAR